MRRFLFLTIVWATFPLCEAFSSEAGDEIRSHIDELVSVIDAAISRGQQAPDQATQLGHLKIALLQAAADDDIGRIAEMLATVPQMMAGLPPEVLQQVGELHLVIGEARKKEQQQEIARLKEFRDRIGETVLEAKTAADLDGFLYEIADMAKSISNDSRNNPELTGLRNEISSAKSFVQSWQDHLFHSENNDYSHAISSFGNAKNRAEGILPRSTLLKRERELNQMRDAGWLTFVLDRVEGLDDLASFTSEWAKVMDRKPRDIPKSVTTLVGKLEEISTAHQRFQSGLPFEVGFLSSSRATKSSDVPSVGLALITKLELDFAKAAIPAHLGFDEDLSGIEKGNLSEYLDALTAFYREKDDHAAMYRLSVLRSNLRMGQQVSSLDYWGMRYYNAGLRALEANKVRLAVQCFYSALRTGSAYVPTEDVGERLDELEKEHPEEHELALTRPYLEPRSRSSYYSDQDSEPPVISIVLPSGGEAESEGGGKKGSAASGSDGVIELKVGGPNGKKK